MTDFTKKGTKLPVIPVGTKFKWLENETDFKEPSPSNINGFNSENHDFISLGKFKQKKQTYVICDSEDIGHSSLRYLIKLSTIERIAKEQGMWDDGITMTFKQYEPFRVLELQPDLKVTFPCGNEITIQTNQFLTTTDCEQCKTNQMNPTITLQENGDVIISNTETTTTLSKVTVDEICRLVKEDGEKAKLEVGKWYHYIGGLYVWNNGNKTYGFNSQKRFYEHYSFSNPDGAVEASPEIIEQYLTDEAVRRGFNGKVKFKPIGSHNEVIRDGNENAFGFDESLNQLLYCNYVVFRDGAWSEIIKPETITRAEAEKQLGKVITD